MRKKTTNLDGMLRSEAPTVANTATKSLTLKVEADLYSELRMHAARTGQTHQAILTQALIRHLRE